MTRRGFILEEHIDALTHDDPRTDGFVGPLELLVQSTQRTLSTPAQDSVKVIAKPYFQLVLAA